MYAIEIMPWISFRLASPVGLEWVKRKKKDKEDSKRKVKTKESIIGESYSLSPRLCIPHAPRLSAVVNASKT